MAETSRKHSFLIVYKKIAKMTQLISIAPYFDFNKKHLVHQYRFSFEAATKFVLITFVIYPILWKFRDLWKDEYRFYILSKLNFSIGILMYIQLLIRGYFHRDLWEKLYIELILLHEKYGDLGIRQPDSYPNFYKYIYFYVCFPVLFFVGYIIIFCNILRNQPVVSTQPQQIYIFMLGDLFLQATHIVFRLTLCAILYAIKNEFDRINSVVSNLPLENHKENVIDVVNQIEICAFKLNSIIELLVSLFSLQFFFITVSIFCVGLEYLLIVYNFKSPEDYVKYLFYMLPLFLCIYACDIIHNAAEKLSINLLAVSTSFQDYLETFEKLKDVSFKLRLMQRNFTAARFLVINRKMLVSLLFSVVTYFFVIQQMYGIRQRQ